MKENIRLLMLTCMVFVTTGCSMFGESGVEIAPYTVLKSAPPFEVRHYERMVLVTTPMSGLEAQNSPFSRLFDYISGQNSKTQEIPMTAPVFMDQGQAQSETMSFVMPASFTMDDTPQPQDPNVKLEELQDYTVATVTFNGRLQQDNIQKHQKMLEDWIGSQKLETLGPAKAAGYNPPFTIPALRRNEVLIPIKKP